MKNLFSAIISSPKGRLGGVLFALLATTSLWAHDFEVDGIYYNYLEGNNVEVTYEGNDSFEYDNEYSDAITIPSTVTYNGNTYSVTSIGDDAFSGCSSLTNITIPNTITSIGEYAFYYCSSLTAITIPDNIITIGGRAFYHCSLLTSIIIPQSVMSIGPVVVGDCPSLTSIIVENGNIIYDSRENCNAIIETATNTLIAGCPNTIIPDGVTNIGWGAFSSIYSLSSIAIPNSVTNIGDLAFYMCSSLASITIPNNVTNIGEQAFYNCYSLTSIIIPDGLKNIGKSAFSSCPRITLITIGNSVTYIGDYAFCDCSSLTTMVCKATEAPELGNNVFLNIRLSEATLYVPAQSLDDYKAADQWKNFGTILPIEEEKTEEEIKLQDTDMTIVFTNSEDNDSEIYRQTITIKLPTAPTIAGFTFLYWQPVAEPITNEITIQAIYEADTPTSAEVYTNPANPTQKLLRNGQVYILQDGKTYTVMGQEL